MPEEKDGEKAAGKPQEEALIQPPVQACGYEHPPSQTANHDSAKNKNGTIQLEKDIRSGERWLIGIGIATLIINTGIACIYYGQLKEMRKATEANQESVDAATQAVKTADATLKLSRQQFETAQRAWIAVIKTPVRAIFYTQGAYGKQFTLNSFIQYHNFGNLPAINVRFAVGGLVPDQTSNVLGQAKKTQRETCERAKKYPSRFPTTVPQTAFPGETKQIYTGIGGRADQKGQMGKSGDIQILIVGCIFYGSISSSETHETPFILDVERTDSTGNIRNPIFGEAEPGAGQEQYLGDFFNGAKSPN